MRLGQTSFIYLVSKVVASAIGFVATIYFARILGADVLGIYSLVLAIVSWLVLGGKMGISTAVTKRVSEGDEAGEYVAAGTLMILTTFVITAIAVYLFRDQLDRYVGVSVAHFVVFMLFGSLTYALSMAVLKGRRLVHIYAILDPLKIVSRSLVQIAAVVAGFGLTGLLVGYTSGWLISAVIGFAVVSVSIRRPARRHLESLFSYAKYSWLGRVRTKTFNYVDVLVLGLFVPSGLIGVYSVSWSIAKFFAIFTEGISTALFPEISRISAENDTEAVAGYVNDALAHAGLFLIPGLVGSLLLGGRVLRIYGGEFVRGTAVLTLLIAACFVYGYQQQLLNTLDGIDRPDITFRVNAVFILSNAASNVVLVYLFGWIGAAVATVLSATLALALAYLGLRRLLRFEIPVREIATQWLAAGVMSGVVLAGDRLIGNVPADEHLAVSTLALVALGAGTYFLVLFGLSARFRTTVIANVPVDLPASIR